MLLRGQKLFTQCKQANDFLRQLFGLFESFAVKQNLSDELIVRNSHRNRSEELLQVVREFWSASIPLAGRIQSYENTAVVVHLDSFSDQLNSRLIGFDRKLYDLNLLTDGWQLFF